MTFEIEILAVREEVIAHRLHIFDSSCWPCGGGGIVGGIVLSGVIGYLLVKPLTGIFDPPPDWLVVPLPIVIGFATAAAVTGLIALAVAGRLTARASPSQLRDL